MTNQELVFNPFGKFIAKLTKPLFNSLGKTYTKKQTNRLIPLIVFFIIFFLGIIYWLFFGGSIIINVFQAYIDTVVFLYFFYIFSLIIGIYNGMGNVSFISTFFHRTGLPLVNLSRKLIKIQSNKIVVVAIILLTCIYFIIEGLLIGGQNFFYAKQYLLSYVFVKSISQIIIALILILRMYTWLIIIRVLISWVAPNPYNMVVQIITALTEPIMEPFRRIIPPFGFIDISPIIVIFMIEFVRILLSKLYLYMMI
jgi:YggT family protein